MLGDASRVWIDLRHASDSVKCKCDMCNRERFGQAQGQLSCELSTSGFIFSTSKDHIVIVETDLEELDAVLVAGTCVIAEKLERHACHSVGVRRDDTTTMSKSWMRSRPTDVVSMALFCDRDGTGG